MHGAPKRVSVGAIRAGFPDGKKQRRDNSDGEMPIALCGQDRTRFVFVNTFRLC